MPCPVQTQGSQHPPGAVFSPGVCSPTGPPVLSLALAPWTTHPDSTSQVRTPLRLWALSSSRRDLSGSVHPSWQGSRSLEGVPPLLPPAPSHSGGSPRAQGHNWLLSEAGASRTAASAQVMGGGRHARARAHTHTRTRTHSRLCDQSGVGHCSAPSTVRSDPQASPAHTGQGEKLGPEETQRNHQRPPPLLCHRCSPSGHSSKAGLGWSELGWS